MKTIKNISVAFIGSGNVATKLAQSLYKEGVSIKEIYSPTYANAQELADTVDATPIESLNKISENIDIIIISISDSALKEIDLPRFSDNTIICHTSGSVNMDILNKHNNYGVFYPLQTFSKDIEVDIADIPFCIEGNTQENQDKLMSLASVLSNNVSIVTSLEREKMHLAAVFINNFTNAMYSIAEDLMQESGLNFDYLKPLIKETANKAIKHSPREIQTGPAVRNDKSIINKHIRDLNNNEEYANIYKQLSDLIYKLKKKQ